MKVSPHFDLMEFVPQGIWDQYGPKSLWFVDMRLIEGAEWLRGYFNAAIIINNWHTGGPFQNRGFRHPDSTVGGKLSQHKAGRAIDFNVVGIKPQKVWSMLVDDWQTVAQHTFFTTIEDIDDTPSWVHIDGRSNKSNEPLIVKP